MEYCFFWDFFPGSDTIFTKLLLTTTVLFEVVLLT